jgi:hypothetical protein
MKRSSCVVPPDRTHDGPSSPDAPPPSVGAASAKGADGVAAQPLPPTVAEALADPIVRALMAADHVDEAALRGLIGRIAAWLAAGADCSRQANSPSIGAE